MRNIGVASFVAGHLIMGSAAVYAQSAAATPETNPPGPGVLAEVLVTAQKVTERIQDVPVPVTILTAESLASANQLSLNDYYSRVPGLSLTPDDFFGSPELSIRGITTGGQTNPTVGIVIDDVPYGASMGLANGNVVPDIDPSDLANIEVLRGPQGTLYGASSLGGLLKYETIAPSMKSADGFLQVGTEWIENGNRPGYVARGAVNVPVGTSFALRLSGFTRQDPGYVDNILTGQRSINKVKVDGGHLSALWAPTEEFFVNLSALLQHGHADGAALMGQGLEDLRQNTIRGTGWYDKKFQAYSATTKARLGSVNVTSLTGFNITHLQDVMDYTPLFGPPTQAEFGVTGTPGPNFQWTNKFSQELRLAGTPGGVIDWLAGAFYTHERSDLLSQILASDPLSGQVVGAWISADTHPTTYVEYAAFGDVTVHFSDKFDAQFGLRESQNRQTYSEVLVGPFDEVFLGLPSSPVIQLEITTKANAFTYLFTPRYKFTPDMMLYARLASGYRPGGPNSTATVFDLPRSYKPDKTTNYELGFKSDFLERRLAVDASAYYIVWHDIQLSLFDATKVVSYYGNGGHARSYGVELSVEARPVAGLTLSGWVTAGEASLTQDLPPNPQVYGRSGSRLPYSTRFSGNLASDWQFRVADRVTASVGATLTYVGDRLGVFTGSALRQDYPAYMKADLRAGIVLQSWKLDMLVNNVANRRGLLGGGLGTNIPINFSFIQPRTIGLNVSRQF